MNLFKLSVLVVGLICIITPCLAENNEQNQQTPQSSTVLVNTDRGGSIKRPKAPDRQQVTCAYDGEMMYLNFAIPEGMATLSVTDESMKVLTYEIDTTPLDICVTTGALIGNVYIELETEKGNIFTGTIE